MFSQPRRAGGRPAGLRHCSQLYDLISIPAIGIFLLVEILLIVVVLHFRERRPPPDYSPLQWHGNRRLEIVWTVVPPAIVLSIGAGERSSFDT